MRFELRDVSSIDDRIRLMREQVRRGLRDPEMRRLGLGVTRSCRARDDLCELGSIFGWTQGHLRYTGDIALWDTYPTARRAIEFGGDDCDGHAITLATLAMENGFRMAFRVTSHSGEAWEHVFALAAVPKVRPTHFVPMDTTIPGGRLGDLPPSIRRQRDYWV